MPRLLVLCLVILAAPILATSGDSADRQEPVPRPLGAQADVIPLASSPTSAPLRTPPPTSPPPADRTRADAANVAITDADSVADSGREPMAASAPVRLEIPSISVDSGLMDLGLQADGGLEVPPEGFPAGWYTGAPTPGELGPAIIAGHVDWGGRPGVFSELRDLSVGEEIIVSRHDGSTARFRVTRVERFGKDEFPTQEVYGDLDHAGLRLITCGGDFDQRVRSYQDNIVVFAELAA